MDRQPVLEGERLLLRPLREDDWEALFAAASDPLIWKQHPAADDRWQEPVFRSFFADAMAQGGALAVIDRASGAVSGSSRFQGYDAADGGSVEIGWTFLACSHWGGPDNREMKRLMVGHALQFVERALFHVAADNIRSRRAMEKIGAALNGQSGDVEARGVMVPYVFYEITRESFAAGPLSA